MRTVPKRHALIWTVAVAAALVLHGVVLWVLQLRLAADEMRVVVAPTIEMVVRQVHSAPQTPVAPSPPPAAKSVAWPAKKQAEPKFKAASKFAAVLPHRSLPPSHQPVQPVPTASDSIAPIASASTAHTDSTPLQPGSAADTSMPPAQKQEEVVPPSANAAYLHNPPPDYPPMSRLRHESGTVVVRVLIGADGRAQAARIEKTSGYVRLDDSALTTARDRWRYRPGTRGGMPEAMWYDVPIQFILE
jgi:protein TonB